MQASNIVYTHAWHWTSASGWKQIPVRPRIIMIQFINQRYLQREKWCFATHFDRYLYLRRQEKSISKDHPKTHLFAEGVPRQTTKHRDLRTVWAKALTYSRHNVTLYLTASPTEFPWRSPAPHRHGAANATDGKGTSDTWYHTPGAARETPKGFNGGKAEPDEPS